MAGIEGPIVTQIRALLTPQPLKELRVKNQYINHKELCGAQGVKIAAKDLEKALAGIPLYAAQQQDEVDYFKVSRVNLFFFFVFVWTFSKKIRVLFYSVKLSVHSWISTRRPYSST